MAIQNDLEWEDVTDPSEIEKIRNEVTPDTAADDGWEDVTDPEEVNSIRTLFDRSQTPKPQRDPEEEAREVAIGRIGTGTIGKNRAGVKPGFWERAKDIFNMFSISDIVASQGNYVTLAANKSDEITTMEQALRDDLKDRGFEGSEAERVIQDAGKQYAWTEQDQDRVRQLSKGELVINPGRIFGQDKAAVEADIEAANATPDQKRVARDRLARMRQGVAESLESDLYSADSGFKDFADKWEGDKASLIDEWTKQQGDRNFIFKTGDAIMTGAKTGAIGVAGTVVDTAAGLSALVGADKMAGAIGETGQMIAGAGESVSQAGKQRGLTGGYGIATDISNTVTQMAPMFAGGYVARGMQGLAATATGGMSVYGWSAAQGYGSKLQDALRMQKEELGRDLNEREIADVLNNPATQIAAFGNAIQAAVLPKGLGGGAERAAIGAVEKLTVLDLVRRSGRKALIDGGMKAELKQMGRTILGDTADEAVEEGLNRLIDRTISAATLGEDVRLGDLVEETVGASLLGGVVGGGLPQVRFSSPSEKAVSELMTPETIELAPEAAAAAAATPRQLLTPTGDRLRASAADLEARKAFAGPLPITPAPTSLTTPIQPADTQPQEAGLDIAALKQTFDLTDEQAEAAVQLSKALGLSPERVLLERENLAAPAQAEPVVVNEPTPDAQQTGQGDTDAQQTEPPKVVSREEAASLLAPSEKEGGVDPRTRLRDGDYILETVTLDAIAPNEQGDLYDSTVRRPVAEDYANRKEFNPPPILVVPSRDGRTLNVLDGGHRVTAARMRGEKTITILRRADAPNASKIPESPTAAEIEQEFSEVVEGTPRVRIGGKLAEGRMAPTSLGDRLRAKPTTKETQPPTSEEIYEAAYNKRREAQKDFNDAAIDFVPTPPTATPGLTQPDLLTAPRKRSLSSMRAEVIRKLDELEKEDTIGDGEKQAEKEERLKGLLGKIERAMMPKKETKAETPTLLEYAKSRLPKMADKLTSESQVESFRAQWEKEYPQVKSETPAPAFSVDDKLTKRESYAEKYVREEGKEAATKRMTTLRQKATEALEKRSFKDYENRIEEMNNLAAALGVEPPAPPQPTPTFSVDDKLTMRSPFTNEDAEVSFRGYQGDKAVVWTGRTQMQVPSAWLRRPGTPFVATPESTFKPRRVEDQIALEEGKPETPAATESPVPTTKAGLVAEVAGPVPNPTASYDTRQKHDKLVKELQKRTVAELRNMVVADRARAAKDKATADLTTANYKVVEASIAAAGTKWRSELGRIAAENGDDGFKGMPDNRKGDEIYRVANRLAQRGVTLLPGTPNEVEASSQYTRDGGKYFVRMRGSQDAYEVGSLVDAKVKFLKVVSGGKPNPGAEILDGQGNLIGELSPKGVVQIFPPTPAPELSEPLKPFPDEDTYEMAKDVAGTYRANGKPNLKLEARLAAHEAAKRGETISAGEVFADIVEGHPMGPEPRDSRLSYAVPIKVRSVEQVENRIARIHKLLSDVRGKLGMYDYQIKNAKTKAAKDKLDKDYTSGYRSMDKQLVQIITEEIEPALQKLYKQAVELGLPEKVSNDTTAAPDEDTKPPEQMTPEEVYREQVGKNPASANKIPAPDVEALRAELNFPFKEGGDNTIRPALRGGKDARVSFTSEEEARLESSIRAQGFTPSRVWRARKGSGNEEATLPAGQGFRAALPHRQYATSVQHAREILSGTQSRLPVSAAAVDTYGITLPEGYTKQGDLYVYAPTEKVSNDTTAEKARLEDLMLKRGQAQNKVRGVTFSKAEEEEVQTLAKKYRGDYVSSVNPETDEVLGTNNRGEKVFWSTEARTYYTMDNGRPRTAPWVEGLPDAALDRLEALIEPAPTEFTTANPPKLDRLLKLTEGMTDEERRNFVQSAIKQMESTDPNIGREWDATYGRQRIVGFFGNGGLTNLSEPRYEVQTVGKQEFRSYGAKEIDTIVADNEYRLTPEYAKEKEEEAETRRLVEERKARQAAEKATEEARIDAYLDTLGKTPMQRGKLRAALLEPGHKSAKDTQWKSKTKTGGTKNYNGNRFEVTEQLLADGYTPTTEQVPVKKDTSRMTMAQRMERRGAVDTRTEYRLTSADGESYFPVTKAEHDLATWLTEKASNDTTTQRFILDPVTGNVFDKANSVSVSPSAMPAEEKQALLDALNKSVYASMKAPVSVGRDAQGRSIISSAYDIPSIVYWGNETPVETPPSVMRTPEIDSFLKGKEALTSLIDTRAESLRARYVNMPLAEAKAIVAGRILSEFRKAAVTIRDNQMDKGEGTALFDALVDSEHVDGRRIGEELQDITGTRTLLADEGVTDEEIDAQYERRRIPAPASAPTTATELSDDPIGKDLLKGDYFTDGQGNTWQVWLSRGGSIEAHPVENGKTVVNNQSVNRWAVTAAAKLRDPDNRTDITAKVEAPATAPTTSIAEMASAVKEAMQTPDMSIASVNYKYGIQPGSPTDTKISIAILEGDLSGKKPPMAKMIVVPSFTIVRPQPIAEKVRQADITTEKGAIEALEGIASTDMTRYVLNSIHFDAENQVVVATDGRRIVVLPTEVKGKTRTVAARDLKAGKSKTVTDKKGAVITGNFPNWRQVIPDFKNTRTAKLTYDLANLTAKTRGASRVFDFAMAKTANSTMTQEGTQLNLDPELLLSILEAFQRTGATSVVVETATESDPMLLTADNGAYAVLMLKRANDFLLKSVITEDTTEQTQVPPDAEVEAAADEVLTPQDKQEVASILAGSDAVWDDAIAKKFRERFTDWLVTGKDINKRLIGFFTRVAKKVKNTVLVAAVAISINNATLPNASAISAQRVVEDVAEMPVKQRIKPIDLKPSIERAKSVIASIKVPDFSPVIESAKRFADSLKNVPDTRTAVDAPDTRTNVEIMADWVILKGDNDGKPFAIADKTAGMIRFYDKSGNETADIPALFGRLAGDKVITDGGVSYRTPAGRFEATPYDSQDYGPTVRFNRVGNNNFLIHRIPSHSVTATPAQRKAALESSSPLDNRVTSGCINIDRKMIPQVTEHFVKGGVVYVLPETESGKGLFEGFQELKSETPRTPMQGSMDPLSLAALLALRKRRKTDADYLAAVEAGDMETAQRMVDSGEVRMTRSIFDALNVRSELTQRATTIHERLAEQGIVQPKNFENGKGLVYGDGKGVASEFFGAESYEPFPPTGFQPDYAGDRSAGRGDVIGKKYETILNTFVLNVVDPQTRDFVVRDIANLLEKNGKAVIVTRGTDVLNSKPIQDFGNMSRLQKSGSGITYQKGFTQPELVAYLQDTLGEGFTVQPLKGGSSGDVRAQFVKNTDQSLSNPLAIDNGPRLQPSNKRDAEYLAAVEAGDMDTAQRMVSKAARMAGKMFGKWFHGQNSNQRFISFDPTKGNSFGGWNAFGSWFTLDEKAAKGWANYYDVGEKGELVPSEGQVYEAFLFIKNPLSLDGFGELLSLWEDITGIITNKATQEDVNKFKQELLNRGYDGIVVSNVEGDSPPGADASQTYAVALNSKQIKSADPVTRDKQGNVIPLSQRFNVGSSDIRYQAPTNPDTARFNELTSTLPAKPTQADLDAWKVANPEAYAELKAMRERVLREAGYGVEAWHGTPTGGFTVFDKELRGRTGGRARGGFSFTNNPKAAEGYANSFTSDSVALDNAISTANKAIRKALGNPGVVEYFENQGYESDSLEFSWEAIDGNEEFASLLTEFARDLESIDRALAEDLYAAASQTISSEKIALQRGLETLKTAIEKHKSDQSVVEFFREDGWAFKPRMIQDEVDGGMETPEITELLNDFARGLRSVNSDLAAAFSEAAAQMRNTKSSSEVKHVFLRVPKNARKFQATPETLGEVVFGLNVSNEPSGSAVVDMPNGEKVFYVADPSQIKSADSLSLSPEGELITPDQWGDAGSDDIRFQNRPQGAKGSAELTPEGKVLLKGLENPDFTTAVHEMAHGFEMSEYGDLTDVEVATLKAWAGSKTAGRKMMETKASEKFARGWERYIAEGKAPLAHLQALFDKMAKWMLDVYGSITNAEINIDISPEVRAIFDKLASRMEAPAAIVTPAGQEMFTEDGSALPPAIAPTAEAPPGTSEEDEMAGRIRWGMDNPEGWNPEGLYSMQERRALEEAEQYDLDTDGWEQAKRTFGDLWDNVTNQPSGAGEILLDKLVMDGDPNRVLTDPEIALLTHESLIRKNAVDRADRALTEALEANSSKDLIEERQKALWDATSRYQAIQNVAAKARTASGRSLNAWKYALRNDFSFATLQSRALTTLNAIRVMGGKKPVTELPEAERKAISEYAEQQRELQAEIERLRAAQASNDPEAYQKRIAEQDALIAELIAERKAAGKKSIVADTTKKLLVDRIRKAAAEARGRLKADSQIVDDDPTIRYQAPSAQNDPRWYDRVLVMAEPLIADPTMSAARFADLVKNWFGNTYVGVAGQLRKDTASYLKSTLEDIGGKTVKSPTDVTSDLSEEVELTRRDVYELARAHVFEGARDFEVMDLVFADLSEIFPELTKDDVTQLFTNYGVQTKLSPTEEAKALRTARSLELVQKQIDDLESSGSMKRTGMTKDDPSSELRALRKKRDDLAKQIGYVPTDPETQLSSAQTAAKKRMLNEIEELENAIDTDTPRVRVRRGVEYTEEMNVLKEKLLAKREEYDDIFGQERTPEERMRLIMAGLDRQIAKERDLINKGILKAPTTTLPVLDSPELTARREALKQLRLEKFAAYDLLYPGERSLAQAMKEAEAAVNRRQAILDQGVKETAARRQRGEGVNPTAALQALWEAADALDILIKKIRKDRPLTPAQKQKQLDRAYDQAIATREKLLTRIRDGDILNPPATAKAAEARTRAIREESAALRKQLTQMQREAEVGVFSRDAREAKRVASIEARIAELRRKRAVQDFSKRQTVPPITSARISQLELDLEQNRREYEEDRARAAFKTLGWGQQTMEFAMAAWHARQMFNLSGDFGIFGRQLGKLRSYMIWEDVKAVLTRRKAGEKLNIKNGTILGKTIGAGLKTFMSTDEQARIYAEMATDPRYAFHKANGFDLTSPHDTSTEINSDGRVRLNPMALFDNRVVAAMLLVRGIVKTAAATSVALATGAPVWNTITKGIGESLFATGLAIGGATFARRVEAAQQTMLNVARWNILEAALLIPSSIDPSESATTSREITEAVMTLTGKVTGKKGLNKWVKNNSYEIGLFLQFPQYKLTNFQSVIGTPIWNAAFGSLNEGKIKKNTFKALGVLYSHMYVGYAARILTWAVIFGVWDDDDEESQLGVVMNPNNPNFGKLKVGKTYVDFAAGWQTWFADFSKFFSDTKLNNELLREGIEVPEEKTARDFSDIRKNFLDKQLQANIRTGYEFLVEKEFRRGGDLRKMGYLNQADMLLGEVVMNLTARDIQKIYEEHDPATATALTGLLMSGQNITIRETNAEKAEREAEESKRFIK